jgi:hypothetical protein
MRLNRRQKRRVLSPVDMLVLVNLVGVQKSCVLVLLEFLRKDVGNDTRTTFSFASLTI